MLLHVLNGSLDLDLNNNLMLNKDNEEFEMHSED